MSEVANRSTGAAVILPVSDPSDYGVGADYAVAYITPDKARVFLSLMDRLLDVQQSHSDATAIEMRDRGVHFFGRPDEMDALDDEAAVTALQAVLFNMEYSEQEFYMIPTAEAPLTELASREVEVAAPRALVTNDSVYWLAHASPQAELATRRITRGAIHMIAQENWSPDFLPGILRGELP